MLLTIAIILLALWAVGLLTGYTLGGLVHVLIVIAIVAVIYRLISGRRIA
ncbi:MAG TPA: lmo0937 family membrane protein [candidate division Zixibacteria bacterium]|mgnify:CR=1 FL=1|nr:lmo0937 family membrane protein [candidate division Zixibacteria bacterium]